MADFTAPASNAGSVHEGTFPVKAAIVLALAALADWLFYGHGIGISAAIFAVAVACGSLLANLATLNRKQVLPAGVLLLVALVPAIEEFNVASLTFIVLALGTGLLLTTNRDRHGLGERAAALCDLYLVGPFRFFRDAIAAFNLPALKTGFAVWFIPIVLGGIFVFLLVSANPLLEKWISLLNLGNTASYVSLGRVLFWARGAVDRMALYPRPVERQAGDAGRSGRSGGTGAGNAVEPKRLLRCCDDPALADPVQFAVRRSNRS